MPASARRPAVEHADAVPVRYHHRPRIVKPSHPHLPRLHDLWTYRRLAGYFGFVFVERRYRRTWLGWLWIPLRPAVDIGTRVLFFGGFLGVSPGDRPYFMFFIVGSAAWQLFSIGTMWAVRSLDLHRSILDRLHLPRATAVAGAIVPGLLEFLIYTTIFLIGVLYYYVRGGGMYLVVGMPTIASAFGIVLLCLWIFAVGLWLAPLATRARDVRFLVRYVFSFWYFVTPVIYPTSFLPDKYQPIAEYNPLSAPVELVKYGLLGTSRPPFHSIVVSLLSLAVVLGGGLYFFHRLEHSAASRI